MVKFINISEKGFERKKLYRFVPISKVKESLINKNIFLSKPEKWNDPYEKYFISRKFISDKSSERKYLPMKNKIFSMCFTERYNSEAYWKTYAPYNDGIKLVINGKELITCLKKLDVTTYIGMVEYINTNQFQKVFNNKNENIKLNVNVENLLTEINTNTVSDEQIKLLLLKRKSFLFEEEIRLFIISSDSNLKHFQWNVNLNKIVDKFYFDPRMDIKYYHILRDEFIKYYKIDSLKIGKSTLYNRPKFKGIDLRKYLNE